MLALHSSYRVRFATLRITFTKEMKTLKPTPDLPSPLLQQLQRLQLQLDVLLYHHPLEYLVVVGRPHLLEERLVELGPYPGGGLPARSLELRRGDADVLHVGAQHEVHQVLVLVVHLLVLVLVVLASGVRLEDCAGKRGVINALKVIGKGLLFPEHIMQSFKKS